MTDQPASPEPADQPRTEHHVTDDHGAALDRAARSIKEAKAAEGEVAANEDITVLDDQRAGEYSEDPGGAGGQP